MRTKMCGLCKNFIIIEKEKYVHVENWNKRFVEQELWCHESCFGRAMNRNLTPLEKQAKGMLDQMKPMLNQLTGKNESYEIK